MTFPERPYNEAKSESNILIPGGLDCLWIQSNP